MAANTGLQSHRDERCTPPQTWNYRDLKPFLAELTVWTILMPDVKPFPLDYLFRQVISAFSIEEREENLQMLPSLPITNSLPP
ncbi:hypothetical protein [Xanthomonas floridensis]|uniref:Uncharacterized protein n=1 Tax=Xanthomonas floridensis TaxID=1843580 RepID=A0ABU5Q2F3_9XANT|nr:hypothetical protein [Xanthomonas floridensis]MEA5126056.1 hypothetical protein [Xanthomonas floridensis]MEA5133944.1 hypothetical protein [Xanthomonas floridensis]